MNNAVQVALLAVSIVTLILVWRLQMTLKEDFDQLAAEHESQKIALAEQGTSIANIAADVNKLLAGLGEVPTPEELAAFKASMAVHTAAMIAQSEVLAGIDSQVPNDEPPVEG